MAVRKGPLSQVGLAYLLPVSLGPWRWAAAVPCAVPWLSQSGRTLAIGAGLGTRYESLSPRKGGE
jgi:hypothetical protein